MTLTLLQIDLWIKCYGLLKFLGLHWPRPPHHHVASMSLVPIHVATSGVDVATSMALATNPPRPSTLPLLTLLKHFNTGYSGVSSHQGTEPPRAHHPTIGHWVNSHFTIPKHPIWGPSWHPKHVASS
jgi:hypothetical protein